RADAAPEGEAAMLNARPLPCFLISRRTGAALLALALAAAPAARAAADAAVDGSLPRQGQARSHAGKPLDASQLLSQRLGPDLPTADLSSPRALAEAEVAALQLIDLTGDLDLWQEALQALAPVQEWLPQAPPRVAFLLQYLRAASLRNTGHPDEARAISRSLG